MKIESISNKTLRKAAQEADSDGAKKLNGTLDACELETFMKKAYAAGCCTGDILSVAGSVTIDSNDKDTANKVKLLQDIEKLEKEIETKKKQLKEKEAKLEKMDPFKKSAREDAVIGGVCFGGIGAAAGAVTAICLGGPVGWVVGGAVLLGGASAALGAGIFYQQAKDFTTLDYEGKVQLQQYNNYKASDVDPLKEEISTLEKNLEVKKASLYK